MNSIIFQLDKKHIRFLGSIRCLDEASVADDGNFLWLKLNDSLAQHEKLKSIPVKNTYSIDSEQRIFPLDKTTPTGHLRGLLFTPLKKFIQPVAPVACLPGRAPAKQKVQPVACSKQKDPYALMVNLQDWKNYGESASTVRLATLFFAVCANGNVLITGYPLPPLPGIEYWSNEDVLLPNGFAFKTKLDAGYLNKNINPGKNSVIVFFSDGSWQKIERSFFVQAKRSAIRFTSLAPTEITGGKNE